MGKLRECPFCGCEASVDTVNYYIDGEYYCAVVCTECRLEMLTDEWSDEQSAEEEAIAKWNTRHEPPTPNGTIVPAGNERLKNGND